MIINMGVSDILNNDSVITVKPCIVNILVDSLQTAEDFDILNSQSGMLLCNKIFCSLTLREGIDNLAIGIMNLIGEPAAIPPGTAKINNQRIPEIQIYGISAFLRMLKT